MKELYELKKMLCEALEEYSGERELSPSSLQMIDTLAHACKNVCKIIEACEEEEYSNRGYGRSYGDRSYENGMSNRRYSMDGYYYDGGMSNRRGRAANGRFISRDGSEIAHKLREMIAEAPDDGTRQDLQRLADKMESM